MKNKTWDEIIARYERMYSRCIGSEVMMERWGDYYRGMLALVPRIRNLPELKEMIKWVSHETLYIRKPDIVPVLTISYSDNSYVLRSYLNGAELLEERKAAAEEVVGELQNQIKTMREV